MNDGIRDQSIRVRGGQQISYSNTPCGVSEDRNLFGIATECADVVVQPGDGKPLVEKARVLRGEGGGVGEAKNIDAVATKGSARR